MNEWMIVNGKIIIVDKFFKRIIVLSEDDIIGLLTYRCQKPRLMVISFVANKYTSLGNCFTIHLLMRA